jgi:repressor
MAKTDYDTTAIGSRIRKIRQDKGMTLEEFGALFNASRSIASRWEKGKSIPNAERLKAISKVGNTTVEELLHGGKTERYMNFLDEHYTAWKSHDLNTLIEMGKNGDIHVISSADFSKEELKHEYENELRDLPDSFSTEYASEALLNAIRILCTNTAYSASQSVYFELLRILNDTNRRYIIAEEEEKEGIKELGRFIQETIFKLLEISGLPFNPSEDINQYYPRIKE